MESVNRNNFIGSIEILLTGVIWGFIGFFVKELSNLGASSELIAFFRVFFAFIFASIISLILYKPKSFLITKQQLFWCIVDGITTQGIFNIAYAMCVEKCGVAIAAVLLYTSPVFNAIISYLVFKERMGLCRTLVIIINMIGCIVAATALDFNFQVLSIVGLLMGLLSGLTYGASPVLGKYANKNPNVFIVIAYNELFASLFMLIFTRPFKFGQNISTKMWIYGIIYGVLITGIAYMFYYDGVKRMSQISIIPVLASVEVVVAAAIGVILYKEPLNIINYIGITIVILSIIVMSILSRKVKKVGVANE